MTVYPEPFIVPDKDIDRLYSHVLPPNIGGCRDWLGFLTHNGYGRFTFTEDTGRRRLVRAHNAIWVVERGPFLPNLQPDHLCRRPSCTHPDHIEWITQAENRRRQLRYILAHGNSDPVPPSEPTPRQPRQPRQPRPYHYKPRDPNVILPIKTNRKDGRISQRIVKTVVHSVVP